MKLEKKIGQLFLLGFQGASIDNNHPITEDIRKRNLGGVILFDRLLAKKQAQNNILNPGQLKTLTMSLQKYASESLLIAVDQEGGSVRRLKPESGFPATASAAELGESNDSSRTAIHAACTANSLLEVGINYNLAPVVDLNIFPENPVIGKIQRSFSDNANRVIPHAAIWIREHQKRNILSCLKHFPGHGSSKTDSHLGFTDISNTWQKEELIPFKKIIAQTTSAPVESVMLGHLFHTDFDTTHPTSLSPIVVTSLLRNSFGFKGVIITDDIQMKAITDKYGLEESVYLALAAGVDMIIVGNNLEYDPGFLKRIIPGILQAIKEKRIPEGHIHAAFERIIRMKEILQSTN